MDKEIIIFKALDFLFCEPDNPEYENVFDETGFCYGLKMVNIIRVCNQFSFVPATPSRDRDGISLVFGKYPVFSFLLAPVGKVLLK